MRICKLEWRDIFKLKIPYCWKYCWNNSYKVIGDNNEMVGYIILENHTIKKETKGYRQFDNINYWNNLYSVPSKKISYIKATQELIYSGEFHKLFDTVANSFEDRVTLLWIDIRNPLYLYYTHVLQGFAKIPYTDSFNHIYIYDLYHRFNE